MNNQLIFETDYETYKVLITRNEGTFIEGSVYPVIVWHNRKPKYSFRSTDDGLPVDELNDDCECHFNFSYVWRGVWEGRIYFQEEEYWSEDLSGMAQLWEKLKPKLQKQIKLNKPEYTYD